MGNLIISRGTGRMLGVIKDGKTLEFSIVNTDRGDFCLQLFYQGETRKNKKIVLKEDFLIGNIYSVRVEFPATVDTNKVEYQYLWNKKPVKDPYARKVIGRERWGNPLKSTCRYGISADEFDWKEDKKPNIPFDDLIMYQLHVRGYTKHKSSKVQYPGTFCGLMEKIPYMKELGINGILALPIYDFEECIPQREELGTLFAKNKEAETSNNQVPRYLKNPIADKKYGSLPEDQIVKEELSPKLNYWGYGASAAYFAPKASYAATTAETELKELVYRCHKAGIEFYMDVFFPAGTNQTYIRDFFRYWILEYHVDGFRFNENVVERNYMIQDPVINSVKLFTTTWNNMPEENRYQTQGTLSMLPKRKTSAEMNEGFQQTMRRFLKSDEGMISDFLYRFVYNPVDYGIINFMANANGFTMTDMVSYDVRHNEENGENDQDGTEYNYSWNCGAEGVTRKRSINRLREQQLRNAWVMLLLSQGTPMILAGDEFGRTKLGNNNSYCQDNKVSWLNWKHSDRDLRQLEYVKKLIAFRKNHPIFHKKTQFRNSDYLICGMPDISYHGKELWKPDFSVYSRSIALYLCGEYAQKPDGSREDDLYLIYHMFWESDTYALPEPKEGYHWVCKVITGQSSLDHVAQDDIIDGQSVLMQPRSIAVLALEKM
ncbi:MAG: alpha-amylase [Lachnospiraceae bacterium]|nr:alpha-amylase [Lachnospiraceae bacterium]